MSEDAFFSPHLVGEFLRWARHNNALSLRQLSAISKVSASQLLRIESGEFDVRLSALLRACASLGIPAGVALEQGWRPSPGFYAKRLGEVGLHDFSRLGKLQNRNVTLGKLVGFFANCCVAIAFLARSSTPIKLIQKIDFSYIAALEPRFLDLAGVIDAYGFADRLSLQHELKGDPLSVLLRTKIVTLEIVDQYLVATQQRDHPFSGVPNFLNLL